jgi:uncharacterized membrane protein
MRHQWWPLVIVASAVLTCAAQVVGGPALPVRAVLAFWFLLVCPGMALVPLLQLGEAWVEVPLALALSIGLDTVVAETLVLTRHWSPSGALALLVGISLAGGLLQLSTLGNRTQARRGER